MADSQTQREANEMNIKVTDRELEALLIAIQVFEDSYAGWSPNEMSDETRKDLQALARISRKIEKQFDATTEALANLAN